MVTNIQSLLREHLKSHPVCEDCNEGKSIRITPFGTVRAICDVCFTRRVNEFYESTKVEPTGVICPDCKLPYLQQSVRVDYCPKCGHSQGY